MKVFAVVPIHGGVVTNVVVGDDIVDVSAVVGECVEVTEQSGPAEIGSLWNGTVFEPPVIEVNE